MEVAAGKSSAARSPHYDMEFVARVKIGAREHVAYLGPGRTRKREKLKFNDGYDTFVRLSDRVANHGRFVELEIVNSFVSEFFIKRFCNTESSAIMSHVFAEVPNQRFFSHCFRVCLLDRFWVFLRE